MHKDRYYYLIIMNIAIYHGFLHIHFEMFGYLFDYCYKSFLNLNIYIPQNSDIRESWKQHYIDFFKKEIIWNNIEFFNPEKYDLIFILTDDDLSFKEEWFEKYNSKIIIIDHHCNIRRFPTALYRIGTRYFTNRPSCHWALPCYNIIDKYTKNNIINNNDKIHVVCIGIQNIPTDNFLIQLFENFSDLEFHIVARNINYSYNYSNIHKYIGCSTHIMNELLTKASYVLCLENPLNLHPQSNSISGAIPLSYNFGCQLIIPSTWQRYYNFNSVISYNDNIFQQNGITKLNLTKNIPINLIYNETYNLISQRNKVFDLIINKIYPNFYIIQNHDLWFCKIINTLKIQKPKVFIECIEGSYNNIDIVKSEFREIHSIQYNKEIYNNNVQKYLEYSNIYLYNHTIYKKILKEIKINEPAIIYLDLQIDLTGHINILNEYNILELKKFGKRTYNDIIIVNNINYNNDGHDNLIKNIINIYNRICLYYYCTDINRLVIIS
jgi:hypothetical protein